MKRKTSPWARGGGIIINRQDDYEAAEILREKGTNRSKFFRGEIDKYTWVDYGSSYLPSDLNAAYLWAQLEQAQTIQRNRIDTWETYNSFFRNEIKSKEITLPTIPADCVHNAHMYYIKLPSLEMRTRFISYMKENGILCVFHYVPLHSSPAGIKFGRFSGTDVYTTADSERLVRLPLYYNLKSEDLSFILDKLRSFFNA